MEDSHYNSSYFWTPIPTVAGQFENVMFINKIKEQLLTDKTCPPASYQSPPLLSDGADPSGAQEETKPPVPPPTSDGITVLPLPSATLMTGLVIAPCSGPTATSTSTLPCLSLASSLSTSETHPAPPEKKPPSGEDGSPSPKPPGPRKRKCRLVEGGAIAPFPGSSEEEASRDGRSYRCRICPLTFLSKSDMQLHSKSHSESKPHHCPHCSKTFANSSYLAQHVRIHSGAKPYACSYCQRSFRQLSHLQQHTRIHTGDRPYKCAQPGCEKSFTQLSNLQSHRRQHNKDKPFKCHHCHRAYTDSPSLQVHLSTHTVKHIKAFACNSCRKMYTSETYLMKHMKKHKVPDRQPEAFEAPTAVQVEAREPAPCPYDLFKADAREEACLAVGTAGSLRVDAMGSS